MFSTVRKRKKEVYGKVHGWGGFVLFWEKKKRFFKVSAILRTFYTLPSLTVQTPTWSRQKGVPEIVSKVKFGTVTRREKDQSPPLPRSWRAMLLSSQVRRTFRRCDPFKVSVHRGTTFRHLSVVSCCPVFTVHPVKTKLRHRLLRRRDLILNLCLGNCERPSLTSELARGPVYRCKGKIFFKKFFLRGKRKVD